MKNRKVILRKTNDADIDVSRVDPGYYDLPETRKVFVNKLYIIITNVC